MRSGQDAVRVLGAVVAATVLSGCGATIHTLAFPTPPPAAPTATTVAPLPDTHALVVPPVPGITTTTAPAIGPGGATIMGTVLGPAGPVAGATVEADRVVGSRLATMEATTGTDGSFTIAGVLGGVYRLRAWQSPALALVTPQLFFLADTGTHQVSLLLGSYSGLSVSTSMAPQLVGVGGYANLVVSVSSQVVGADGVIRPSPVVGQPVSVDGGTGWTPLGLDPATTDTSGEAAIEFQCAVIGAGPLIVTVAGATPATVTTPSCVAAEPTTTTLPPDSGTVPGGSTTLPGGTGGPGPTTSSANGGQGVGF